jgi:hypothetical protein
LKVGPNQTSLISSDWGGLSPGQRMCFRVSAYNTTGSSAPTAWDCITMPKRVQQEHERAQQEVAERRRQEELRLESIIDTEIQDNFIRSQIQHFLEEEDGYIGTSRRLDNTFTDADNIVFVKITKVYDSNTLPCREFKVSLVGRYNTQVERVKMACLYKNSVWRWW